MPANKDLLWKERVGRAPSVVEHIQFPENLEENLGQDKEWCYVTFGGKRKKISFHDYVAIFSIPGLYEEIFYKRLQCSSPYRVTRLLEDVLSEDRVLPQSLTVLDLGAGNGMVGEALQSIGVERTVGADIIPEARRAALRDRPEIYQDYIVADFLRLKVREERALRRHRFNCLVTVATLGFGDIPTKAFLKALSLVSTPGWIVFNIKEDFLSEIDDTGFSKLIRGLSSEKIIRIDAYRRYRHRLSLQGQPLYYVGVVARKLLPIPEISL